MINTYSQKFSGLLGLVCLLTSLNGCRGGGIKAHFAGSSADLLEGRLLVNPAQFGLAESCAQTTASLYPLNSKPELDSPLATTPLDATGRFIFTDVGKFGVKPQGSVQYMVTINGCGTFLARIVTGGKDQDVTAGSTLLAYAPSLTPGSGMQALDAAQVKALIEALQQQDTTGDAYDELTASAPLNTAFQTVFGFAPDRLIQAPPRFISIQKTAAAGEREPALFAASAAHWSPSYKVAYLWKMDDQPTATSANYTYTPSANAQGAHTVSLYIGKSAPKDSAGADGTLDLSVPYLTWSGTLNISDTMPAAPPAFRLASGGIDLGGKLYSVSRDLDLALVTGTDLWACETFTALALTENVAQAPLDPGSYALHCDHSDQQAFSYHLKSSGDGLKTLRLWAIDAAGRISALPNTLEINLDETAPQFASLALSNDVADGYLNAAESLLAHDLVTAAVGSGFDNAAYAVASAAVACGSGTLAYGQIPLNTSSAFDSDGVYKVCVKLTDVVGNPAAFGASPTFTVKTSLPVFTSITLLNGASDGYLNAAEHALSQPLVGSLSGSGYTATAYDVVLETKACTDVVSYSSAVPLTSAAALSAEGRYKVCVRLNDSAGNMTYAASASFTFDQTAPGAFSLTSPAAAARLNSATPTISWGAAVGAESYELKVGSVADCSTAVATYSHVTITSQVLASLSEGSYYLCLTAQDTAGNKTTATGSGRVFTVDLTPPAAFDLTAPAANSVGMVTTPTVSWNTSAGADGYDLFIDDESSCTAPYRQSYPGQTGTTQTLATLATGTYFICLKSYDLAGNTRLATSQPLAFTVDRDAPELNTLTINGGDATTSNVNVNVALTAVDATSKIISVCLKMDTNSAPADATDPCWVAVDSPAIGLVPAKSLVITTLPYRIGYASTLYTLYAWVMDEAHNISALKASGAGTAGIDKNAINFGPESPPVITSVIAAASDSPSNPMISADSTIAAGGNVFIKWRVVATNPLGATPISLEYTTDDTTFTPIAMSLANGPNGSCSVNNAGTTLDDQDTGCYLWSAGAPVSTYFKIRVKAQDSHGFTSLAPAPPINPGKLKVLAGNTDLGLGGSAKAAVFLSTQSSYDDPNSLVVTDTGVIYVRDIRRGILKIDPTNEKQTLLLPTTGVASGDGGPVSGATLNRPSKIALDSQNRLLIYDYDRIRRVDLTADRIDTLIGGGALTTDGVDALDVSLTALGGYNDPKSLFAIFAAMPNGELYFSDSGVSTPATGWRIRVYKPSTGKVTSIYPSGTGDGINPAQDITVCYFYGAVPLYDKAAAEVYGFLTEPSCNWGQIMLDRTGVSTPPHPTGNAYAQFHVSRTGDLYGLQSGLVARFNPGTHTWDTIIGANLYGTGHCPDGTAALSCHITPSDVFVTTLGKIYFIDGGMIRTLDTDNKVVSLYGQSLFYGDGGPALEARFNSILSLSAVDPGKVIILDKNERRFREFTRGGTIAAVAGNGNEGVPDTTSDATQSPIAMGYEGGDFVADAATGNIFYNRGGAIAFVNRLTNRWVDLTGAGATPYQSADGLPGSAIGSLGSYVPRLLGINGSQVLSGNVSYSGGMIDSMFKLYSMTDGTQTHLAGVTGPAAGALCADGTSGASCGLPTFYYPFNARAFYDTYTSKWLLLVVQSTDIRALAPGGTMETFATLNQVATSFTYYRSADATTRLLFYCGIDGRLYKRDVNTSTETALPWTIPSLACTGRTLVYDSATNSLIFPYTQNGLAGVAEYLSP